MSFYKTEKAKKEIFLVLWNKTILGCQDVKGMVPMTLFHEILLQDE